MEIRSRLLAAAAFLPVLLAPACGGPTGPRDVARPGILRFYGDGAEIAVPSSATAGRDFTVTVRTFGGGCTSKGWTRVDTLDAAFVLRPFDVTAEAPDLACPAILKSFEHTAELSFDAAGEGTVRILGRETGPDGDRAIELERTVTVEPR